MVVEGVTRSRGTRPRRQAAPAVPGVLRLMISARPSPDTPLGARDRAMLLVGFGAALEAWLVHRRTAADLDWTASAASRAERSLFCAVSKTGRVTGEKPV
jgi:hypothetical protein